MRVSVEGGVCERIGGVEVGGWGVMSGYVQCCRAGACWSRNILVGAGATLDKTEENLNEILFVCSNID